MRRPFPIVEVARILLLATMLGALLPGCAAFRGGLNPPAGPDDSVPAPPGPPLGPPGGPKPGPDPTPGPALYLIHGDADYVYHDSEGNRREADREALRQALDAAREGGEIFVFHQRRSRSGFLRPRSDGTFYHYSGGKRVAKLRYQRERDAEPFAAEARVFRQHAAGLGPVPLRAAYFGHEIGSIGMSPGSFAQGLARFRLATPPAGKPFEVIALSTCHGGNPLLVEALAPLAAYVVASPADLHLSFLDTRPLITPRALLAAQGLSPARALADTVARRSFERLRETTQTEVTVAVYDLEQVEPFLKSRTLGAFDAMGPSGWRDCAEGTGFDAMAAARGVTLYYQPPRFGPGKNNATRSGWQCLN